MRIIGLAGSRSGAGKNTVAGLLAAELCDQGHAVKLDAFAAPMKARARGMSPTHWLDKIKWRGWLQDIGTEMRGCEPKYWIKQLADRNNMHLRPWEPLRPGGAPADFLIVTDVRYPNEAEFCAAHGVVWLVEGNHRPLAGAASEHESEQQLTMLDQHVDYIIVNDRPMGDLAAHIRDLVREGRHLREGCDGNKLEH